MDDMGTSLTYAYDSLGRVISVSGGYVAGAVAEMGGGYLSWSRR
jgi:hypothetical protein